MEVTIKELAEKLGVSKTAIRKKMTEEFREKYVRTDEKGTLLVSDEGQKLLETMRKPVETTANKLPETPETELPPERDVWYRDQIRQKDELIKSLMDENKELTGQLRKLSEQVGDALTTVTKGQLADKLIEGQKAMNEVAIGSDGKKHWWQKIGKIFHG